MTNPLDSTLRDLNDLGCGCGAGIEMQTPASIDNRPGLPAIDFRAGVHSQFKASLLASLSSEKMDALRALQTRDDSDLTVGLLDAFASMADVLTFYSERIANESYLRTATERRSVLELARAIGYELSPGAASQVLLAFTVEGGRGAPGTAIIPKGTKVQSIPGPDQKPQTFETSLDFNGRATWNELRLRSRSPAPESAVSANELYLAGSPNLKTGDVLVLSSHSEAEARRISAMKVDRERGHTWVELEAATSRKKKPNTPAIDVTKGIKLGSVPSIESVGALFLKTGVSGEQMSSLAHFRHWDLVAVQNYLNNRTKGAFSSLNAGVFVLRTRVGFFGHNAPKWASLPHTKVVTPVIVDNHGTSSVTFENDAYPISWDNANRSIREDSQGNAHTDFHVFLERSVPEAVKESWIVMETQENKLLPFQVDMVADRSRADYGLSARCTGLKLRNLLSQVKVEDKTFENRSTTAHVHSEPLTVIGAPIERLPIRETKIVLDRIEKDLIKGQTIALKGENADLPGTIQREFLILAEVMHSDVTTLILSEGLKSSYLVATVTLNANVVPATHGETTQEVLGSADASQSFQRFTLKQQPLTFTFPLGASRLESTLEIRVDDILWREVPTFFKCRPTDRVYVLHRADDGTTEVQFGDGLRGARLTSGQENVRAVYRKGIGTEGMVDPEQINLMLTQPLGVKSVTNLLAPQGAEDPQTLDAARLNAPRTVLTLDRVVSLQDYEDFARDFPGVAKAHAVWIWRGQVRGVQLTLLGPNGLAINQTGQPADPLRKALASQGLPNVPIHIVSSPPSLFTIQGRVRVDADHLASRVDADLKAVLRSAFSFTAREFGQGVALSEVIAVIQNVDGVAFVDVTGFEKKSVSLDDSVVATSSVGDKGYLVASVPNNGADSNSAMPAELLILDELSLSQLKVIAK